MVPIRRIDRAHFPESGRGTELDSPSPGRLFVLTGSSGSGKDAVIERLLERLPNLRRAVTAITRAPRPNEREGVNHYFIGEAEFDRWLAEDRFLEWARVFGRRYGTPRAEIDRLQRAGHDVILRIDPQGAATVREQAPEVPVIFLRAENPAELERRLRDRGEDEESLRSRQAQLAADDEFGRTCQHQVVNRRDRLEQAVSEIAAIIGGAP